MNAGLRFSGKSAFVRGAMALAIMGAALLVEYTPAAPKQDFPPTQQVSSALPSAANRPAGVDAASKAQALANYARLPLSFEANNGQTSDAVKYLSRGRGYNLFLTGDEAVLTLEKTSVVSRQSSVASQHTTKAGLRTPHSEPQTTASVLRMKLVGANSNATVVGAAELPGKSNYFIGNDPKKWRTDVPAYAQVKYQGVYPGVDLVYYGNQSGQLEYDFVVAPGGDPNAIALGIGTRNHAPLSIAADGGIVVKTDAGDVLLHKPVVYQEELTPELTVQNPKQGSKDNPKSKIQNRKFIEGSYVLEANNQVGFKVASYDHSKPLVIDPIATYSTYLGGSLSDFGYGITVDSTGAAYVVGETSSTNFPTMGAYTATITGGFDGFVTKLAPGGASLVYSTFIGGSGPDDLTGIGLDSSLNAIITGYVQSTDFPILNPLAGQSTKASGYNETVVLKLNAAGNTLIYSTYLGGSGDGFPEGFTVDAGGDAYVGGETSSTTYPLLNPIQSSETATYSGTLSRLHWNGTALSLVYSTYWGGNSTTSVNAVAVDTNSNVYIGGFTLASNLVTTTNAVQTTSGGSYDGFVTKLNWNGGTSTLSTVYSTYLGGSGDDSIVGLVIDGSGDAYVTGYAGSSNFPTANALQSTFGGQYDAFVTELNPTGTGLVYSTFLGGSQYDQGYGIALGSGGNVFVAGYTNSTNFPTSNAVQSACDTCTGSSYDAFVTGLNWNGTILKYVYSTYLGGSLNDGAYGIAVDANNNAYITGYTASTDFPTTNGAYQTTYGGGSFDAFVAEIPVPVGAGATLSTNTIAFGNQTVLTHSAIMSSTLTSSGSSSLTLASVALTSSDFALTTTGTSCNYAGQSLSSGATCTIDVIFTPSTGGARTGTITVTDNSEGVVGSTQTIDLTGTGTGGGVVSFSPSTLAIGNQVINTTSAPAVLTLNNTGGLSFTISSIIVGGINGGDFAKTADGCTGVAVAPSNSCAISISFTPSAQGARSGVLVFADNTVGSPQYVNVTGSGTAPIAIVTPSTLPSFGTQNQGTTSASQPVSVNNGGNGPLTIASIVTSANFGETNTCTGNTVAVGTPCTINVTFTPTTNGPLTGTLTITDNSLGVAGTTQTVSLSGTGAGAPYASVPNSTLTFTPILINTTSTAQVVTVKNTGALPLAIASIATTGDFADTTTCGSTLAAGASCTVSVTFTPTTGGALSGALTITDNSNGVTGSTQVVQLAGTGQDFALSATTPTTQTIAPGGLATYTLSVGTFGGLNEPVTFTCTGAPAESTCVALPSPTNAGGFVGVSVTTTAPSALAPRMAPPAPPSLPRPQMMLLLAICLVGITWTLKSGKLVRTRRLRASMMLIALGMLLAMAVAGCGGGASTAVTHNAGTPAGTYPLTVTGTAGGVTHSVTLTLIVS